MKSMRKKLGDITFDKLEKNLPIAIDLDLDLWKRVHDFMAPKMDPVFVPAQEELSEYISKTEYLM